MAIDFSAYDAVLLDLDGTIYHNDQPLPGAIELLRQLQERHIRFACISNSTQSPQYVKTRLAQMGVQIELDHFYTAAAAAADHVLEKFARPDHRPRVFNLATEGIHDLLDARVDWVDRADQPCDAIIIGTPANTFGDSDRQRIALTLLRNGAAAVGICSDRCYPSPRGLEIGAGALTWMLCYAAGIEPVFCGKPQEIFFHELCHRLNVRPESCLLIGDNIEADIMGGKSVGMRTILTLLGVAQRRDLVGLPEEWQPDLVIGDLSELL